MPIQPSIVPKQQQQRTEIGVKGLKQSSQPSALQKKAKKARSKKADLGESDRLDRIVREDANLLVEEVGEDQRRQRRGGQTAYGDLELSPGHATELVPHPGRAFRLDERGRPVPPEAADVEQGNLQDAWLLAGFAAVASAQPGAIFGRIEARDGGLFAVRLGDRVLTVAPEFPAEGYAETQPRGYPDTLWVALLEKAFALRTACSYAQLEGGNPARALDALVDGRCRRHRVRPERTDLDLLARHHRAHRPMVLVTQPRPVDKPLVASHAYAVVDVSADARKVTLYNPWGTRRGSRPLSTVLHQLDWAACRSAFEFLYVGGEG